MDGGTEAHLTGQQQAGAGLHVQERPAAGEGQPAAASSPC